MNVARPKNDGGGGGGRGGYGGGRGGGFVRGDTAGLTVDESWSAPEQFTLYANGSKQTGTCSEMLRCD